MTNTTPRTGQQYSISYGDYEAVITELGATMRKVTYKGKNVIVPLGADDPITCCHGQLLVPFPNRIAAGTYEFEGKTYTLPIDEHDRNTAIHGYGYRSFWKLESLTESSVTQSWRAPFLLGYPFAIKVYATHELTEDGLKITVTAENYGDVDAPWALAIHPWLDNGFNGYGDEIDGHNAQCHLTVPAATHVTVDENLIPTGTEPVEGTKYDLNDNPLLVNQPFDDAWTDLKHDADGTVTATFTRPDGLVIKVGGDETITSFQVCTGTGFPAFQHPAGTAVEPQTAYANAFNTGKDLIVIKPGESSTTTMFIKAEQH
ncbi:aldose 1-epimerase family protein [Bifidobacterium imperatoris]|uniref:Aldose 1-epimerase family protein n=1 Tax=Bifidobacterium imperatoris TaxID=2020965 RepID=A0A2N5IV62_9BIFI|nr:aldose 1-epimerase family protein [Bifidobacterium imperatoris]PLS25855.1 aldose epimerase [Bifidobacterium imperatoris]QSY57667.1 aldose 1-epimerase family protein [Bifidobacterium imperatoris]